MEKMTARVCFCCFISCNRNVNGENGDGHISVKLVLIGIMGTQPCVGALNQCPFSGWGANLLFVIEWKKTTIQSPLRRLRICFTMFSSLLKLLVLQYFMQTNTHCGNLVAVYLV